MPDDTILLELIAQARADVVSLRNDALNGRQGYTLARLDMTLYQIYVLALAEKHEVKHDPT